MQIELNDNFITSRIRCIIIFVKIFSCVFAYRNVFTTKIELRCLEIGLETPKKEPKLGEKVFGEKFISSRDGSVKRAETRQG